MGKVYEELEEVKSANEKLRTDYKTKTELLDNLKKLQNEQSVQIGEAKSVIEKQSFEIDAKTREISELNRTNDDLQRSLREKDSVIKRLNEANDKIRANGEENYRVFEDEKRKLVSALDEANEKNIDIEQKNNVYRAKIEGLKGHLAASERKMIEVEKTAKDSKETKRRGDVMSKIEEEKTRVEEELKWKKEQFKHLEEAYEKLENQFKASKKANEEERTTLLNEIYSLQTKVDSQTRISEDLEKKLLMCNSALSQEETRRKKLEIQVSEFRAKYEDAFQDARTKLDDFVSKRDEEVADLRQSLGTKEAYFKEMKYENGKLERENEELLASLKELQEATIQGSGNSAISKLKNKFRKLENIHKNCSANLRSKESEWSSRLANVEEEINDYKLQLQSKEASLKELELKLENRHIFKNEQFEAHEEIEAEREKVACLLKRIETLDHFEERNLEMVKEVDMYKETLEESSRLQIQMKEKMKEAEKDYEEKLLQVCDALDNTNSDLVAEREKVSALTRKIESFCIVKEKNLVMEKETQRYKEMLEESEKCRVLLEEKISQLEKDSKENIRELCSKVDIAYAKIAEETEKTASLIRNEEHRQKELEESTKSQLADVSDALDVANCELSGKTSEAYQLEFQLWVWKSIAKRLKVELEQSQNLRKRVEASLLEQVGVEEALRQERIELKGKLKTENSKIADLELWEQKSLRRELEDALFAHINAEKVKNELESSLNMVYEAWEKLAASKILTEVETEAKILMIVELEGEIKKLEASCESVSCLKEAILQMKEKLRNSEEEVSSLVSEKRSLVCFIGEMENRMSKMCEEEMKLMKSLEKTMQCCDGFGKENKNSIDSPRLMMKHEDVAIEDRSPFRQLNH